jgi:hypothetical protein
MYINKKNSVAILLFSSSLLLSILVPGGPVETRHFYHIDPLILGAFNLFLTCLGMISLLLIYFVLRNMKWAYFLSAICGLSYLFVYILDLTTIFPNVA